MTPEQLAHVAAGLSYQPGWEFRLEMSSEGPVLAITAEVPSANDMLRRPIVLGIRSYIPPMRDEQAFLEWVDWRVRRVAIHEHEEFLRHNGQRINDPQHQ